MSKDIPIVKKFEWVAIKNCTNADSIINSEKYTSPVFEIPVGENITEWHLQLVSKEKRSIWSLYLFRNDNIPLKFSVEFSLFVVAKSKKYLETSFRSASNYFTSKYESEISSNGNHEFITTSSFAKMFDQIVSDENFTIGCEMVILTKKSTDKQQMLGSLFGDIQKMYEKEVFTDFEFRCSDGVSVKCHRSVLGVRSPVFEAMLSNDMEEAREGFADVPDCDSKLMKEFLRFIYCGNVQNINVVAKDLIFLADKYDIEGLKEMCINNCIKTLTKSNIVENLQIVDKISGCVRLFGACFVLFKKDFKEVSKSKDWKKLSKDMLKKIAMLEDAKAERIE